MQPTIEFHLLAQCCQASFASTSDARLTLPRAPLDWARFVRLARFHRLQAVAWDALSRAEHVLPAKYAEELASHSEAIAAQNLRSALMARDLLTDARERGIDMLFVKGLTSGALAFRSALIKTSADTDILIAPADLNRATALLTDHGFAPRTPPGVAYLARWHRLQKESQWQGPDGSWIDLHLRLADNRALIPAIGLDSRRQDVEIVPGIVLPTLARDELIAYLCVHGASSAWFRLKWLAELAGLLQSAPDLREAEAKCRALGAGRATAQAFELAAPIFGPPGARRKAPLDWQSQLLVRAAEKQLAIDGEPVEPTAGRLGTLRIHWTQLLLKPGAAFIASECARQFRTAVLNRRLGRA